MGESREICCISIGNSTYSLATAKRMFAERTMSQPDPAGTSRKKPLRNGKNKLKSVPSTSTYILNTTEDGLENEKIDTTQQRPKIASSPSTSKSNADKTNSGACFGGRRLWTSVNKPVEESSNAPAYINGTIEEESEFVSLVTKQLYLAESQMQKMQDLLSKAEERGKSKDEEIERLKRKVKDWEIKCKNQESLRKKEQQQRRNQIDNSEYLYQRCLVLEHKIFEMEKFLADYGLIWVGDSGGSINGESDVSNYIETCYEQLIASIDRLNVAAGKGEVHVHRDEKGGGASFKTPSCMSLKFFKNGMTVQGGPLRLYTDPRTTSFIRDILDGYFPSELQEAYPNGVPFKVEDRRTVLHTSDVNVFPGQGYRLGKQTSNDGASSTHLRNSKISSCGSSRQCSPRTKEGPCSMELSASFATRSLKSKNSLESRSIDLVSLRSQILASHNNVCSDSHLQSHINAELALSSRREKRVLATKNAEYEPSMRERNSKSKIVSRFPSAGRSYHRCSSDRSYSRLSPARPERIGDRSRTRSRSASISNRRLSASTMSRSKASCESGTNAFLRSSASSEESGVSRNPRISKSATHTRKTAPPILHQINEPSGRSGELRLKVRSLNGGTVYLVHLSTDDSVAKLYELLNKVLPTTWQKGYKILVNGYSPKRLEEQSLTLRESGITRDSVLHLVND